MRHDDVVQRPATVRVTIPVLETPTACAGAAASYVLRRIAYRAGAYAPGIDEAIFHEVHAARDGQAIDDVEHWFITRIQTLHELGYRLQGRRIVSQTHELLAWIEGGRGYRGAVMATSYEVLHPADSSSTASTIVHAVGLASEGDEAGEAKLVMIDPWTRTGTRNTLHPALELAHGKCEHQTLAFHWVGWS